MPLFGQIVPFLAPKFFFFGGGPGRGCQGKGFFQVGGYRLSPPTPSHSPPWNHVWLRSSRLNLCFRFTGKDFRLDGRDSTGWEAAIKYYRFSHLNKSIPFPDCLKIGKIRDKSGERNIDYLIGKMANCSSGDQSVRKAHKVNDVQLCIKTIKLEEEFKFLTKIIFCTV